MNVITVDGIEQHVADMPQAHELFLLALDDHPQQRVTKHAVGSLLLGQKSRGIVELLRNLQRYPLNATFEAYGDFCSDEPLRNANGVLLYPHHPYRCAEFRETSTRSAFPFGLIRTTATCLKYCATLSLPTNACQDIAVCLLIYKTSGAHY